MKEIEELNFQEEVTEEQIVEEGMKLDIAPDADLTIKNIKNDSLFIREEKLQLKKAQLNTSITLEQLKNESVNINDSFIFYDEIEGSFNYLYLSHYLYLE